RHATEVLEDGFGAWNVAELQQRAVPRPLHFARAVRVEPEDLAGDVEHFVDVIGTREDVQSRDERVRQIGRVAAAPSELDGARAELPASLDRDRVRRNARELAKHANA